MKTKSQGPIPDLELQQAVLEELSWEPMINAANIIVNVRNGVVIVGGTVESFAEKVQSRQVVFRLQGVQALVENLTVELPQHNRRSDSDISKDIASAYKWNTLIPRGQLQVTTEHGYVTLEGTVKWSYQRKAAAQAIKNLTGMTGMANRIIVAPPLKPHNVKAEIIAAFERSAQVDAQKVRVEIDGAKVTLSGTVRSWSEKAEATRVAMSAPGIAQVDDLTSLFWVS